MYIYLSISIVTLLAALGQPPLGSMHEELLDAQETTAAAAQELAGGEEAVCTVDSAEIMSSPTTSEDEDVPASLVVFQRADGPVCCDGYAGCVVLFGGCPRGIPQVACPCPPPAISGD